MSEEKSENSVETSLEKKEKKTDETVALVDKALLFAQKHRYTLIVLWLGIGDSSKVALLFLSAFAPIFIQTVFGAQRVPQDRINGAKSLGANKWTLFWKVIFPSALPDILTGLRTAVGVAYATLVAAEMIASASGIAWMVLNACKSSALLRRRIWAATRRSSRICTMWTARGISSGIWRKIFPRGITRTKARIKN